MLSLRQLLTPVSEEEFLALCLEILDGFGFQATSWQTNSASRTFTQLVARVGSDLTYTIADIVAGNFAGLAKGRYADLLGQYMFRLTRVQPTPTEGQMVLTSSPGAPDHYIAVADNVLIVDDPTNPTNVYTIIGSTLYGLSWILSGGSSLIVYVQAQVPGSRANNIPANYPRLSLADGLVGVTVSNPPNPPTTPGNTWITKPGTDAETDGEGGRFNARMLGRWDRLTYGNTDGAYRAWVLEALPAVTRLTVREGELEGQVRITCATALGGLSPTQVQTIIDYLTGATDGVGRKPINDILQVVSANQVTTPPLTVQVYVRSPFSADAVTRVSAALTALLGSLPIGGKHTGNSSAGKVLLADLYATVMAVQGVQNVQFPSIEHDIVLNADDVYAPLPSITMVIVP